MTAIAQNPGHDAPSSATSAPSDRFLLISDRPGRSADLATILGLAGDVSQISAGDLDRSHDSYFRMIVDIDLANVDTVLRLRRRLATSPAGNVPRYFVVGEDRHHGTVQARALGASAIISRPFEPDTLLADINADCSATFADELA